MIIDFQHHYVPYELARRHGIEGRRRVEVKEGDAPKVTLHERLYDLDLQVRELEEMGIDAAVLSCLMAWDASYEDCRLTNDSMARAEAEYGGKFVGLAHLPTGDPPRALEELERAAGELGLRGIALTSQVGGRPLDSPELFPIYEKAEERGLVIFVHPAMAPKGYALAQDHDLGRILVREFDLCLAAVRLIAGGVLERFPGLNFVLGHFGGGIAALKERVAKRVHRFDRPLSADFEELFDRLYFDMAGFEGGALALEAALRGISPRRLVFATDYPQDFTGVSTARPVTVSSYIEMIRARSSPQEAELMLGETARRLLGLS